MTMTLEHPAAEDLGRFAEGTLDDAGRAAIVAHIADCDECRVVVVDSAEFVGPVIVHSDRRWWMATAAALVIIVAGAGFLYIKTRDRLAKVKDDYGQLKYRPIEARLSGVAYVPRNTMRGPGDETEELALTIMRDEAAEAAKLRGNAPTISHVRGVALLLGAKVEESIPQLQEAATREPNKLQYQVDLAAALIAAGHRDPRKLERAFEVSDRAVRLSQSSTQSRFNRALRVIHLAFHETGQSEALFNRALALELLGRTRDAIKAYDDYLAVDRSSRWAIEAKRHQESLRLQLPQS